MMREAGKASGLLHLPAELILHILSFLEPFDLADVAQTCTILRGHSYDDSIWQPLVVRNTSIPVNDPHPLGSFRELFAAQYPHWFLLKNRIWFGDNRPSGKLLITRYEPETGTIAAYTVIARRGRETFQLWERNRHVIIHSFNPTISLHLSRPELKLVIDGPKTGDQANRSHSSEHRSRRPRYDDERVMEISTDAGLYSSFMLCRTLPQIAISPGTQVWPPQRFPAETRTRNLSGNDFNSSGHRPTKSSQVSLNNFRVRKWAEYTGRRGGPNVIPFTSPDGLAAALEGIGQALAYRLRAGIGGVSFTRNQDVTTYATIPESCYTPTVAKPWQGIWCGDYGAHGCEFLLIRQPDLEDETPLPDGMNWLRYLFGENHTGSEVSGASSYAGAQEDTVSPAAGADANTSQQSNLHATDYRNPPSGRLEAIKITGDPNIPRGEYTFIAPDIGSGGFIRVADEEAFRGARIVRSAGHVAETNFEDDRYTPSQLIMISHDKLAHFWEEMALITCYHRVDLDALLAYTTSTQASGPSFDKSEESD